MSRNLIIQLIKKIRFFKAKICLWFTDIRNRQTALSKIQRRIIIAVLIFIIIFCLLFVSKTLYLSLVEEKPLLELPELKIEPEPKTIEEILEDLRPPEREVPLTPQEEQEMREVLEGLRPPEREVLLTPQEIQGQEQEMKEILEGLRPN